MICKNVRYVLLFIFFNYICIDSLCIYFKCVWLRTKASPFFLADFMNHTYFKYYFR